MYKSTLSSGKYILLVSLFIIFINNQTLFSEISNRVDLETFTGVAFLVTLYSLIVAIIASLLFILGQKFFLKPLIIFLLLFSSVLSYFTQELGIIFDEDMVRNTMETVKDNNKQEALELLSFPLITHVLLYGVLPSMFFAWIEVSYKSFFKELIRRIGFVIGLVIIVASLLMMNFKQTSYLVRENRDLTYYNTPIFAIDSIRYYVMGELDKGKKEFKVLAEDAKQRKRNSQRIIGVMVVGETSRADHYSLNGYPRETNPQLKKETLVNYSNNASCGTSTAFSVPCMFSFLNRGEYSPNKAALQSNSLDVLEKAGVEVLWLDNNSSCKGVCVRTGSGINFRYNPKPNSPYYSDGEMFDEALLEELDNALKKQDKNKDILIVLHTLGSHGPRYYKRYPSEFAQFKPECKKSSPQECSDKEIINSYDNTILYTDHVLAQLIKYLKEKQADDETFMIYASDHGESLGEKGIYLHGMPYFLAPVAQTHIPMIAWFSNSYMKGRELDMAKIKLLAKQKVSHDNLSHTLLSAFDVETKVYESDLDLLKKH